MSGAAGSLHRFDSFYNPTGGDSFYTSNPGGESLGAYYRTGTNVWHLFMGSSSKGINGQSVSKVYRFYSDSINDHLFKTSSGTPQNYRREGIIGVAFTSNGPYRQPVYRYYRSATGDHRYDTSSSTPSGYVREGIAWYSPILVYGCGDPNASNYNGWANQSNTGCNYYVYGCTDSRASNYDPSANQDNGTCNYPTPIISLSLSQNSIIQGGSSTLSWTVFNSSAQSISNVGPVASSGSLLVSPSSTTTYTLSANYYSYTTASDSETLTVYEPVIASLIVDDSTIVSGQGTVLRWDVQGDASTVDIQPGIGSTNLTSYQNISPTQTTTYTLSASGPGGSDSAQVTVTVLQPPSVSINGPVSILYGSTATLSYEGTNVTQSLVIIPSYYDLDGNQVDGDPIALPTGDDVDGTIQVTTIPWGDRGPSSIDFAILGTGAGGLTANDIHPLSVIIDQTPDLIDIPESDDKISSETPVITPDVETTTLTLTVNDIDIPVEVKADYPIQVEFDTDGNYQDIRQI